MKAVLSNPGYADDHPNSAAAASPAVGRNAESCQHSLGGQASDQCGGSVRTAQEVRRITDMYRTEWSAQGNDPAEIPFLGTTRYIVVAKTDDEAMRLAREAYPASRKSNEWLWRRQGCLDHLPIIQKLFPDKFEDLQRLGHGFAGSPASVRQFVQEQAEEAGLNYIMAQMLFGTLPVEDAIRSVELFGNEVIPAFANSGVPVAASAG